MAIASSLRMGAEGIKNKSCRSFRWCVEIARTEEIVNRVVLLCILYVWTLIFSANDEVVIRLRKNRGY